MKSLNFFYIISFILIAHGVQGQTDKVYQLTSPDGHLNISITAGKSVNWSINNKTNPIIVKSPISIHLASGEILGKNVKVVSTKLERKNSSFKAFAYIKDTVKDVYNQFTINFKGNYGLIFRAYDDAVAYRLFTNRKEILSVVDEEASFNFDKDYTCYVPFVRDFRGEELFIQSFEALYTEKKISTFNKDTLGFLPVLIDMGNNQKVVITEVDLEDYPGMFLKVNGKVDNSFIGLHAPYPLEEKQGGFHMLNTMISKRDSVIAKVNGTKNFPWRVIAVSNNDTSLLNNDIVQKLASPSRITDISWIKPGKIAWDWWNNWNISHVDFRAGINTETYKYYIDFASANKLEYVIMDEGWSNELDLMSISPRINLEEIIDYGKKKNVGIILWAAWYAVNAKMDEAFKKYSEMGVKGFKIDFMDRDDQKMVSSLYTIAQVAAKYSMIIDYHGMYKPTGLQRTYPNILNFEGVKGMENVKWTPSDDVPHYDVTIPFIRMLAGQMDYTPGAMRNATRSGFTPNGSMPMSQGTRCHQLAMYTIFYAPLQMLADNPTAYAKEQECTDFISQIPTTFDKTVPLVGEVGQYLATSRKKDKIWYVGAMTNWNERDIEIDFSFLDGLNYKAEIFKDGLNSDRDATDYKKEIINVKGSTKMKIHLAPGGGWAAILSPI